MSEDQIIFISAVLVPIVAAFIRAAISIGKENA